MRKISIILITVFLNSPLFFSCQPDTAFEDSYLYDQQQLTGDDDGKIRPKDGDDDDDEPDDPEPNNNIGG